MKKLLTTALLALTAALTAGAQSRTEVCTFPSEVLGAEKSCTVYLPDGYDRSQESYPVLYLLHGASGCHTDWTQTGDLRRIADEAIAAGMARPMIVVMPDAWGEGPKRTGKHMGYFDNSPVALLRGMTAEQLDGVRSVRWWVDCGDDDFLWKCNVDFYTLMRERDIPLQYRMRDGGHTWRYWQTVLPDALTFVSNGFGK